MRFITRSSLPLWLLSQSVVAIAIVAISSQLRLGKTLSTSSSEHLLFMVGLFATYLGCVLVLAWRTRIGRTVHLTEMAMTVLAFFGGYSLALLVTQTYYSPFLLFAAFVVSELSIPLSFVLGPRVLLSLAISVGLITVSLQLFGERPKELLDIAVGAVPKPRSTQAVINSVFYPIKATFYDNYFDICESKTRRCRAPRNGGGLSTFSNGYLVATGEGLLHFFSVDPENGRVNVKRLRHSIPLNSDAFLKQGPKEELPGFRVMDIAVLEQGNSFTVFASHHYWKSDTRCFVLRISRLEGETAAFLADEMQGNWQTLFETKPCLPLKSGPHGRSFAGEESGGRMAFLDERTMLLTVGDHQFDGWNGPQVLAQADSDDYGKTLAIDLASGKAHLYSRGHRNPQGLYVAPDRTVWSTEHGPNGGDELQVLVKGANYGWPLVTYGVEYGLTQWPLNKTPGDHAGFERPVFSWMPSIAVSNLIGVQSELFPLWKGDLLICSFSRSLWRVRIREGRVAYTEHIEVRRRNGRLRDIMEARDGRIVLWLDTGSIVFLEPARADTTTQSKLTVADRGRVLFAPCATCHGASHGIGPELSGIVGRSIGASPGFEYSEAMRRQSGKWTEARLDEFLGNPKRAIPGTSMQFTGIENAEDRASLIAYLKQL